MRCALHRVWKVVSDCTLNIHSWRWKGVSWGRIHELIDGRKRKAILQVCFIQVGEVYAGPPISIWFFNKDRVGELIRIEWIADKACFKQFFDLIFKHLIVVRIQCPTFLSDRPFLWIDIQVMGHHIWRNPLHIGVFSGEDVEIFFKETFELIPDFPF